MDNDIQLRSTTKLSRRHLRQLSKFTDPTAILNALGKEGWDVDAAIKSLVALAKNDNRPMLQLSAIKYLTKLLMDSMERSGLLTMVTGSRIDENGQKISFSSKVVSSVLNDHDDDLEMTEETEESETPTETNTETNTETKEIEHDKNNGTETVEETKKDNDQLPEDFINESDPVTDFHNFGNNKLPQGDSTKIGNHFPGISGVQS